MIADTSLNASKQRPEICLCQTYPMSSRKRTMIPGDNPLRIGRSALCEIPLNDELVSRVHATIIRDGDSLTIRDNRSTNGTFVNGVLTDEARLRDGDILYLGNSVFRMISFSNERALDDRISYIEATMDSMTNSHRLNYFLDLLQREFARTNRYRRDLSVMVCRPILDESSGIGRPIPAAIMQSILTRLLTIARVDSCLSRLEDGDAIAIFLPECRDLHVRSAAQRFRDVIEEKPFRTAGGHDVQVQLAVHAAYSPIPDDVTPGELLSRLLCREAHVPDDNDFDIVSAGKLSAAASCPDIHLDQLLQRRQESLTWQPALLTSDTVIDCEPVLQTQQTGL